MRTMTRGMLIAAAAAGLATAAPVEAHARRGSESTARALKQVRRDRGNKGLAHYQGHLLEKEITQGKSTVSHTLMWKPGQNLYIDSVKITPPEPGARSPFNKLEAIGRYEVIGNPIRRAWYNLMHGSIKNGYVPDPNNDRSSMFGPDQQFKAISRKQAAKILGLKRGGELRKNFRETVAEIKNDPVYMKNPPPDAP